MYRLTAQRRDHNLADIISYLEKESLPTNSAAAKAVLHSIDNYYLEPDGLLCHIWVPGGRHVSGIYPEAFAVSTIDAPQSQAGWSMKFCPVMALLAHCFQTEVLIFSPVW